MKNTFIKFICLTLVFLTLLFCVVGCKDTPAAANESESVNYLVLGLDDAAQNSDIIMLVGCRGAEITFLQIPRDTYFAYGGGQNKINGLFASHKASAGKNKDALSLLSLELSDVLGVDIQAAFALTIPAFLSFVDEIGGVKINMPFDFSYTDEHGTGEVKLSAGENLLNAEQSERFVRYRLGYALGDLSRIDAQKIFFRGLVGTVTDTPFYKLCRGAFAARDSIYTDAGFSDILTILKNKPKKTDKLIYRFITLPGEAVVSGGISYYSVNSKNARCVLKKYFSSRGFDSEGAMLRRDEVAFYNVYYDENASYREYDDGNFGDIKLK